MKKEGCFMGIRMKYKISILVWLVLEPAFCLLSIYVSNFFIIPVIATLFMLGIYVMELKCHKCGKRVLYNKVRIFGLEFNIWTSWIPDTCQKCGSKIE